MQAAMEEGRITSRDLVQMYLKRIARYDKKGFQLNAVLKINPVGLISRTGIIPISFTQDTAGPRLQRTYVDQAGVRIRANHETPCQTEPIKQAGMHA